MAEHINPNAGDFDDPEPGSTWFISLAGAVVFTALVLALSVLYYGVQGDVVVEVVDREAPAQFTALRNAQVAATREYARYSVTVGEDQSVERLRIPVSRAMELVVKDGGFGSSTSNAGSGAARSAGGGGGPS